jgi:hypothetical protein
MRMNRDTSNYPRGRCLNCNGSSNANYFYCAQFARTLDHPSCVDCNCPASKHLFLGHIANVKTDNSKETDVEIVDIGENNAPHNSSDAGSVNVIRICPPDGSASSAERIADSGSLGEACCRTAGSGAGTKSPYPMGRSVRPEVGSSGTIKPILSQEVAQNPPEGHSEDIFQLWIDEILGVTLHHTENEDDIITPKQFWKTFCSWCEKKSFRRPKRNDFVALMVGTLGSVQIVDTRFKTKAFVGWTFKDIPNVSAPPPTVVSQLNSTGAPTKHDYVTDCIREFLKVMRYCDILVVSNGDVLFTRYLKKHLEKWAKKYYQHYDSIRVDMSRCNQKWDKLLKETFPSAVRTREGTCIQYRNLLFDIRKFNTLFQHDPANAKENKKQIDYSRKGRKRVRYQPKDMVDFSGETTNLRRKKRVKGTQ